MPDPKNRKIEEQNIRTRSGHLFGSVLNDRDFVANPNDFSKDLTGSHMGDKALAIINPKAEKDQYVVMEKSQYRRFEPSFPERIKTMYYSDDRHKALELLKKYNIIDGKAIRNGITDDQFEDVVNFLNYNIEDLNNENLLREARKKYGDKTMSTESGDEYIDHLTSDKEETKEAFIKSMKGKTTK